MAETMNPTAPASLDDLALPAVADLDAILDEQSKFDAMLQDAQGNEFESGELGKTDLESRADVPSLTRLHHERRVLARALAPLAALFEGGQNPPAEARRKQHRNLVATLIAKEQGIDGDKQETRLERLANADSRHVEFCRRLDDQRTKFVLARVALMEMNEAIRDREESLRAYTAEVRSGLTGAGQA